MVTVEQIIDLIKNEQTQFAVESLKKPNQGSTFEYGHRVGVVLGFEVAINLILTALKKEEVDDFK